VQPTGAPDGNGLQVLRLLPGGGLLLDWRLQALIPGSLLPAGLGLQLHAILAPHPRNPREREKQRERDRLRKETRLSELDRRVRVD
jgi:hypothetical protein